MKKQVTDKDLGDWRKTKVHFVKGRFKKRSALWRNVHVHVNWEKVREFERLEHEELKAIRALKELRAKEVVEDGV